MTEPGWEICTVQDRRGNRIYLTEERWNHAVRQRPWLEGHLDDVLDTIRLGRRHQDPLDPDKFKYYRPCEAFLPEYNHIVAVVLFRSERKADGTEIPNNFVVTVWTVYIYPKR
jgi:hypothetical protein